MSAPLLFKVLRDDGSAPHVGHRYVWSLPREVDGVTVPGDWHEESTDGAAPCVRGLHLTAYPEEWGANRDDMVTWVAEAEVVYASLRTAEYMLDGDRRGALLCCGYARSRAALVVLHVREATTGVPVDLTTGGPDVFPRIDGNARRAFAALRRADVRASIQRRAEVSR